MDRPDDATRDDSADPTRTAALIATIPAEEFAALSAAANAKGA